MKNRDRLDDCLSLLSDRTRRAVVRYLRTRADEDRTIDEVVEYLIAIDGGVTDRSSRERELRHALRHSHLPKLADRGVISYDRAHGVVGYRSDETVEWVLDEIACLEIEKPA